MPDKSAILNSQESAAEPQTNVCATSDEKMPDSAFDLIIIGAGINGAGIARDAALRGLKVLLLDKGDIGGGTSSASTRLIHGGLRYLEHGEFGLVRESLREREILSRIAPHLVRPLPILIPIYDDSRRGSWTIRAGMITYDLLAALSGKRSVPGHRILSRTAALDRVPGLKLMDFAARHCITMRRSSLQNGWSSRMRWPPESPTRP